MKKSFNVQSMSGPFEPSGVRPTLGPLLLFLFLALAFFVGTGRLHSKPPPRVSDDRELKELDLTRWNCRLEGSAKTPDGVERNRLKNRSAADLGSLPVVDLKDAPGLLKHVAEFEAQTKGKRRKDLTYPQKQLLDPLEKHVVQLTGYLGLAYCGPPETTNCASVDFHDWHLEVFEKPPQHPPGPGDPTPIICEITPRTQSAIYRDNIRIQQLAGFFRNSELTYEPTEHPARKVRVTGFLMWDDEHNGAADVGTTVRTVGANKFHNPWRSAAWEIHPVTKIELLEGSTAGPSDQTSTPPEKESVARPSPEQSGTPPATGIIPLPVTTAPPESTPTATPPPAPQFVTIMQPVKIKIPYGETILPRGSKLPITSRNGQTVNVQYMGGTYAVPVSATDIQQ